MSWRTFKKNTNLDISGLKFSSDKSYIDASLTNNSWSASPQLYFLLFLVGLRLKVVCQNVLNISGFFGFFCFLLSFILLICLLLCLLLFFILLGCLLACFFLFLILLSYPFARLLFFIFFSNLLIERLPAHMVRLKQRNFTMNWNCMLALKTATHKRMFTMMVTSEEGHEWLSLFPCFDFRVTDT